VKASLPHPNGQQRLYVIAAVIAAPLLLVLITQLSSWHLSKPNDGTPPAASKEGDSGGRATVPAAGVTAANSAPTSSETPAGAVVSPDPPTAVERTLEETLAYVDSLAPGANDTATAAWVRKAAQDGDVAAQKLFGNMYHSGRGITQDYEQAYAWYYKAALQEDMEAQRVVGHMYRQGRGVEKDIVQALLWYRRAAGRGDAEAQNMLGHMHYTGEGVPIDFKVAFDWFWRSAGQGYAPAQSYLGLMFHEGNGPFVNYAQSASWYRKAAEQGSAFAQMNLAIAYFEGRGVVADHAEAYKWASLSFERFSEAEQRRYSATFGRLMGGISAQRVAQGQQRAAAWNRAFEKRNK